MTIVCMKCQHGNHNTSVQCEVCGNPFYKEDRGQTKHIEELEALLHSQTSRLIDAFDRIDELEGNDTRRGFILRANHVENEIAEALQLYEVGWSGPEWAMAVHKIVKIQYEMFKLIMALGRGTSDE